MTSDLKTKAVKSAGWLGAGQMVRQAMSLVVTGVLARLILPEAFGLIGMVAVFTVFLELFQDVGLTSAVIQKQDISEEQLSTVFVVTVVLGALLAALTALAGPLIAAFYHKPELASIARLLGLSFFISSFVHVPQALLRKALEFRKLVLIQIVSSLCTGGVSVTLAFLGLGVYALVFGTLMGGVVFTSAVWVTSGWRPVATPRLKSAGKLLAFGGNVTGAGILGYVSRNADYLLIGRFVGATALGIYTMAYRIMLLPLRRISSQLSQVAFPAFSAVQDDKERVGRGYLQMAHMVALVSFPPMAGLVIVAPEAVRVVLGEKWMRVAFLIQVLAVTGALQSVSGPATHIFRSQGRAGLHFAYATVAAAVTVAGFVIGLRWDIEGVAISYTVTQLLLTPALFYLAFRLIRLSLADFLRALRGPTYATIAMVAAVLAYRTYAVHALGLRPLWLLCSEMVVGVAVYGAALLLVEPKTCSDIIGLARLLVKRPANDTAGVT